VTDASGNLTLSCDPQEGSPSQTYGHGTLVAGVIGAAGINSVSGVNTTASIMGLRMAGNPSLPGCLGGFCGYVSDALNAIDFAMQVKQILGANANVRVLNASWGWNQLQYGCGFEDCTGAAQALSKIILAASFRDMLFVAAAGNGIDDIPPGIDNDTSPYPMLPATLANSNIISVAATGPSDEIATFSNYGSATVHLAALGESITSTYPGNQYKAGSGTSLAAPFVSGAAALVLAACTQAGINLTTAALKDALLSSVDVNPLGCNLQSTSDPYCLYGWTTTGGLLNVYNAVNSACEGTGNLTVSLPISQPYGNPVYWARGAITAGSGSSQQQQIAAAGNKVSITFQGGTQIVLLPYLDVTATGAGSSVTFTASPQVH